MRRQRRVFRQLMAINVGTWTVYRGDLALFTLANLALPVISLLIWRAAVQAGAKLPVSEQYLGTYFVALVLVSMLTSSAMIGRMSGDIRLGVLSAWLTRPASPLLQYVASNVTEKLLKLVIVLPAVGLLGWLFRDTIGLPESPWPWLQFAMSTVLAAVLIFALDFALGALTFWHDDVGNFANVKATLSAVLSGQLVPLALAPDWARGFVDAQPFRFMISFPIEILTDTLSRDELLAGLALQCGYVALFCGVAYAVWRAGLRSYTAVGA